jgi:hypothetical protein
LTSIDEASGSFGGNAEQARELAAGITASKDLLDTLIASLSALGLAEKTSQAQASSDGAEQIAAQAHGIADALDNLRSQIEALKGLLTRASARPTHAADVPSASGARPPAVTKPVHAPDASRRPSGSPTELDGSKTRGLERENESALALARAGYDVEQNPASTTIKKPDYRIQGEVWDCYAPDSGNARNIRKAMRNKVSKQQASRIILNLDDCDAGPAEIKAVLQRDPIRGLEEIKIVHKGEVTQFYPWNSEAD